MAGGWQAGCAVPSSASAAGCSSTAPAHHGALAFSFAVGHGPYRARRWARRRIFWLCTCAVDDRLVGVTVYTVERQLFRPIQDGSAIAGRFALVMAASAIPPGQLALPRPSGLRCTCRWDASAWLVRRRPSACAWLMGRAERQIRQVAKPTAACRCYAGAFDLSFCHALVCVAHGHVGGRPGRLRTVWARLALEPQSGVCAAVLGSRLPSLLLGRSAVWLGAGAAVRVPTAALRCCCWLT